MRGGHVTGVQTCALPISRAIVLSSGTALLLSAETTLLSVGGASCGHVRIRVFTGRRGPGGVGISGGPVGAFLIGLSPWDGAASHSGQRHIEVPGQHGELLLIRVVPEVVVVPRPVHGISVGQQLQRDAEFVRYFVLEQYILI